MKENASKLVEIKKISIYNELNLAREFEYSFKPFTNLRRCILC